MNIAKKTALCTLMLTTTFNLMSSDSPSLWTNIKNFVTNWNNSLVATIRQNPKTSVAVAAGGVAAAALACYLYKKSCESEQGYKNSWFVTQVRDNNIEAVSNLLINQKANPNTRSPHDQEGDNIPIHVATKNNNPAMVQLLLDHGADPNIIDEHTKNTALHIASEKGYIEIAQSLINKSANINIAGRFGQTPLHLAGARKDSEMVQLLLNSGADPLLKDSMGKTPKSLQNWENILMFKPALDEDEK